MLKRIFVTNWKTTVCGALLALVWATFMAGKITQETLVILAMPIITAALAISKDGVREETKVAAEDTNPPTDSGPTA